jgi:carboxymethylenebutenolidase
MALHKIAFAALSIAIVLQTATEARAQSPERVTFPSADGKTTLVGYLFKPDGTDGNKKPAVVMMHGRAGAYSTAAKGKYEAATLSQRHRAWGELWAREGYVALLVDGFGPRGYPQGFPRGSYESRPAELNEVTIRPLDAYGAFAYLISRQEVDPKRIGLQGWSNGGSATLATMATNHPTPASGKDSGRFVAAIALYPACGLKGQFEAEAYKPYAQVEVFHGTADEEVSPKRCEALVRRSREAGGDISIHLYPGATHSFDDPGRKRQEVEANAVATQDVVKRATAFFHRHFGS